MSLFVIGADVVKAEVGGHTGNGGGIVTCPGLKPVVLDYYEAVASGRKMIDLESMDREEFFDLMIKRLELGSKHKTGVLGSRYFGGLDVFDLHSELEKKLKVVSDANSWTEIEEWRVHDEFINNSLPSDCHFKQAAITSLIPRIGWHTFRIKGAVESLSRGQQFIIELHEFLQEHNSAGSSIIVRKLVGVLLQKRVNYKKIRLALVQFAKPHKEYVLKFGDIHERDYSWANLMNDLYALDLRNISNEEKKNYQNCPRWLGIVPSEKANLILQLFQDSAATPEDIFMPWQDSVLLQANYKIKNVENSYERQSLDKKTSLFRKDFSLKKVSSKLYFERSGLSCPYISITESSNFVQNFYSAYHKQDRLFPYMWTNIFYVQRIRTYYELKRLGYESPYEHEVDNIRNILNW